MFDVKIVITVFCSVFLAELGDKTQIATMIFSANKDVNKLSVFIGSSLALVTTSFIALVFGTIFSAYLNPKMIGILSGVLFIIIGGYVILRSINIA